MTHSWNRCWGLVVVGSVATVIFATTLSLPHLSFLPKANDSTTPHLTTGHLPLSFELNQGQTDPQVQFLARGPGYTLFLTKTETVLALRKVQEPSTLDSLRSTERSTAPASTAVRMHWVGVNPRVTAQGLESLPGKIHYFKGNDPAKWRTNVPTYAKVHYADIYPGIDLVLRYAGWAT